MKKIICTVFSLAFLSYSQAQTIAEENFESGIPSSWSQTTLATDGGWIAGSGSGLSSQSFTIPDHTGLLATNDDACDCDKSADILQTESYDLSSYSGESVRISMDLFFFLGSYQGATESLDLLVSTGGGSWNSIHTFSGFTDWQETLIIDVSSYAGMSDVKFAFDYNDDGGWTFGAAIDNFKLEVPVDHDIKLTSVKVPSYSATDVPQVITGVVTNLGGSSESAISIDWTDGTNTYTANLSGTLNPGESMSFEHPDGISLTSGESISVDVVANVTGDADMSNNSLTDYTVEGVSFWPTKAVVGEEATGTWCGWCPRGMVGMEYMEEEYGEEWIGIAVHNGDPMVNDDYDSWMGDQVSGYPSALVDREGVIDPAAETLEENFLVAIDKFAYASIELMPLIDENDEVEIRVNTKFAVAMEEDMALAIMIVEDGLTGSGNDWNQANYYAGGGSGQLSGAGVDWHNESGSVAGLTFNDVARDALLDVEGDEDIIPGSVEDGEQVHYVMDKFDWNEDYVKENCRIVAMLINQSTGEIINAAESHLKDLVLHENNGVTYYIIDGDTYQLFNDEYLVPTGMAEIQESHDIKVFPNPTSSIINIQSQAITSESTIQIVDMMGRVVMNGSALGFQQFENGKSITINVSGLNAGIYTVLVKNTDSTAKQTISIVK